MPVLLQSMVIGSWRLVRTEMPDGNTPGLEPAKGYLHFTPDGRLWWEYPFAPETAFRKIWGTHYVMSDRGVVLNAHRSERSYELPLGAEDGCLVILDALGRRSWIRRILPAERPDFLTIYVEPPDDRIC